MSSVWWRGGEGAWPHAWTPVEPIFTLGGASSEMLWHKASNRDILGFLLFFFFRGNFPPPHPTPPLPTHHAHTHIEPAAAVWPNSDPAYQGQNTSFVASTVVVRGSLVNSLRLPPTVRGLEAYRSKSKTIMHMWTFAELCLSCEGRLSSVGHDWFFFFFKSSSPGLITDWRLRTSHPRSCRSEFWCCAVLRYGILHSAS